MRRFNLIEGPLDEERTEPAGFTWRAARLGPRLGAEKVGATLYELQPGERSFPYHYEYGAEEWLLVLDGRPTLRHPDGEDELEPGDLVCFPEGPAGAHKVTNHGDEPARVMIISTYSRPAVAVFPDSDKVGVWTNEEEGGPVIVERSSGVGYWHGEG